MKFVPEQPKTQKIVPYFEDATREGGYAGYTTQKTIATLKSEVMQAISRLGGEVLNFVPGKFIDETDAKRTRPGFSISYNQIAPNGSALPGRIDFAGLPCRNPANLPKSEKMALWMVARAFEAMYYFEQMAPGYSTLMPFMLNDSGVTMFEYWTDRLLALPAPEPGTESDE